MSQDLNTLNREAIASAQRYMGRFAWLTLALCLFVSFAFVANLYLYLNGILPAWAATIILAFLTYGSYTSLHEAAHRNIHGRFHNLSWVGELCGFLSAPLIMIPHSSHRPEHLDHHRYTNDERKDPDFCVNGMGKGFWQFILTPWRVLWTHNTYLLRNRNWENTTATAKLIYLLELVVSFGWRILVVALSPNLETVAVLFLGYVGGAYFLIYWFAYRPHWPYETRGRFVDTASLIFPRWLKPVEWLWMGQNLHSVHHAFPRVPFYLYHSVYREVEPAFRAHGGPVLGIFSREPIPSTAPAVNASYSTLAK